VSYSLHDSTGAILTTVACPVDAHRLLRELEDAQVWRLPDGTVGGTKVRLSGKGQRFSLRRLWK
jgi:hypothetical protein